MDYKVGDIVTLIENCGGNTQCSICKSRNNNNPYKIIKNNYGEYELQSLNDGSIVHTNKRYISGKATNTTIDDWL